jgi:hypothetical protein
MEPAMPERHGGLFLWGEEERGRLPEMEMGMNIEHRTWNIEW